MAWSLMFDVVILTVLWFSAWTDIRSRTVYEPLILGSLLLALITHFDWWRLTFTMLVFVVSYLVVRLGKLGLGDAEILALITAAFGGMAVIVVATVSAVLALGYALIKMLRYQTRRATFAMVPFLALGTTISFFVAVGLALFRL